MPAIKAGIRCLALCEADSAVLSRHEEVLAFLAHPAPLPWGEAYLISHLDAACELCVSVRQGVRITGCCLLKQCGDTLFRMLALPSNLLPVRAFLCTLLLQCIPRHTLGKSLTSINTF